MSCGLFITGTDTGIGKTKVCGLLADYISSKDRSVITQKWVETGSKGFSLDIEAHLALMKRDLNSIKDFIKYISPYRLKFAASPHLASRLEARRLNPREIVKSYNFLKCEFEFVIVEGTGGVLVPFNKKKLIIDIVKDLAIPAVIVVGNKLGAINHALLTIESLRKRRIEILGLVFNNRKGTDRRILRDNIEIIRDISKERILGELPFTHKTEILKKAFSPIGRLILKGLI